MFVGESLINNFWESEKKLTSTENCKYWSKRDHNLSTFEERKKITGTKKGLFWRSQGWIESGTHTKLRPHKTKRIKATDAVKEINCRLAKWLMDGTDLGENTRGSRKQKQKHLEPQTVEKGIAALYSPSGRDASKKSKLKWHELINQER